MEKINIAELLKDCPKGMELDCAIFENLEFDHVDKDSKYPIVCRIELEGGHYNTQTFTKYGCYTNDKFSKCAIFPKGKTTWEEFESPFRDGDIVATNSGLQVFILQKAQSNTKGYCYIGYEFEFNEFFNAGVWEFDRLATEEEKHKLFDAIKDNGYRWNAETKTLEKLIEPIFKVGDRIQSKDFIEERTIKICEEDGYWTTVDTWIRISDQDDWELIPNKFDIATLKPFDKVLVIDGNKDKWNIDFFGYYRDDGTYQCMTFTKNQCIPYEVNQHLLGTTNDCDDFYKTWEK